MRVAREGALAVGVAVLLSVVSTAGASGLDPNQVSSRTRYTAASLKDSSGCRHGRCGAERRFVQLQLFERAGIWIGRRNRGP